MRRCKLLGFINYYKILGIPFNSTQNEIKSAYRKKAKQFHPDINKDNADMFIQIKEAYDILSDINERRRYDELYYSIFNSKVQMQKEKPLQPPMVKKKKSTDKDSSPLILNTKLATIAIIVLAVIAIGYFSGAFDGTIDYPKNSFDQIDNETTISESQISEEQANSSNRVFYEFENTTKESYRKFISIEDQLVAGENVEINNEILQNFRNEVERQKVDGQFEIAREGLVFEIEGIQANITSEHPDFNVLDEQINEVKLNYRDILSPISEEE